VAGERMIGPRNIVTCDEFI